MNIQFVYWYHFLLLVAVWKCPVLDKTIFEWIVEDLRPFFLNFILVNIINSLFNNCETLQLFNFCKHIHKKPHYQLKVFKNKLIKTVIIGRKGDLEQKYQPLPPMGETNVNLSGSEYNIKKRMLFYNLC